MYVNVGDEKFSPKICELSILSKEIWLKIFSYLNYDDLKSASLVSNSWNVLISNSIRFIESTRVVVNTRDDLDVLIKSQRSYRCMSISSLSRSVAPVAATFSLFKNIYELQLNSYSIVGLELAHLLHQVPSLKVLKLLNITILETSLAIMQVQLKLYELFLQHKDESTDWIFNHLHCSQISIRLSVFASADKGEWRKCDRIVEFLSRIKGHVDFLVFDDVDLDNTMHKSSCMFKFRWRIFSFTQNCNMSINIITQESVKLKELCEASLETSRLTLSTIRNWNKINVDSVLRILKFCGSIETFEIIIGSNFFDFTTRDVSSATSDFGTFNSIVNLKIRRNLYSVFPRKSIETFLHLFPSIKELSLHTFEVFIHIDWESMSSNLQNLTTLQIGLDPENFYFPSIFPERIIFPHLKSITLRPVERFFNYQDKTDDLIKKLLSNNQKIKLITFIASSRSDKPECELFLKKLCGTESLRKLGDIGVAKVQIARWTTVNCGEILINENTLKVVACKLIDFLNNK